MKTATMKLTKNRAAQKKNKSKNKKKKHKKKKNKKKKNKNKKTKRMKTKMKRTIFGDKKLKIGTKNNHSASHFQREKKVLLAIPIRVNLLMATASEFRLKKRRRMTLENLFGGNGKRLFVRTISSTASSLGWAQHPGMFSATLDLEGVSQNLETLRLLASASSLSPSPGPSSSKR